MKNLFVILFVSVMCIPAARAQQAQLIVKSGNKGLYLDHSVVAKEGFFSIGRRYAVHPKFLASYNQLDINKGLNIGQTLQIPLTDTNFSQKTNKGMPVYYVVGEKEGLLKVSDVNNNVKMQSLRQWNKLANDNIDVGSKLIVGFLVSGEASVATVASTSKPEVKKNEETVTDKPVAKEEPKKPEEKPVVKTDTKIQQPAAKEPPKTEEKQAVKTEPVADKTVVKEDTNKTVQSQEKTTANEATQNSTTVPVNADMSVQGYFKTSFDQQIRQHAISKNETVTSGIFRTNNGVQDAKYYMLMDGVSSGTIVRVINPENNKAIYAKVLGEMNGIRQNAGLNIRISSIAASSLGINDTEKFIVKINY